MWLSGVAGQGLRSEFNTREETMRVADLRASIPPLTDSIHQAQTRLSQTRPTHSSPRPVSSPGEEVAEEVVTKLYPLRKMEDRLNDMERILQTNLLQRVKSLEEQVQQLYLACAIFVAMLCVSMMAR